LKAALDSHDGVTVAYLRCPLAITMRIIDHGHDRLSTISSRVAAYRQLPKTLEGQDHIPEVSIDLRLLEAHADCAILRGGDNGSTRVGTDGEWQCFFDFEGSPHLPVDAKLLIVLRLLSTVAVSLCRAHFDWTRTLVVRHPGTDSRVMRPFAPGYTGDHEKTPVYSIGSALVIDN
jgi:hypothetical protein